MTNRLMTTAATLLAATAFTMTSATAQAPAPAHVTRWMTTPCAQEDSNACFWDAQHSGNDQGHSFYSIPLSHHRVALVYWDAKYNRHHGRVVKDPYFYAARVKPNHRNLLGHYTCGRPTKNNLHPCFPS